LVVASLETLVVLSIIVVAWPSAPRMATRRSA